VVTYNTGGSPESIDSSTGIVIEVGDIQGIWNAIIKLSHLDQVVLSQNCRNRALRLYDKQTRFLDYLQVFERALIN
jgi:glycosyltransferase involved in cell wall biosynthesis